MLQSRQAGSQPNLLSEVTTLWRYRNKCITVIIIIIIIIITAWNHYHVHVNGYFPGELESVASPHFLPPLARKRIFGVFTGYHRLDVLPVTQPTVSKHRWKPNALTPTSGMWPDPFFIHHRLSMEGEMLHNDSTLTPVPYHIYNHIRKLTKN